MSDMYGRSRRRGLEGCVGRNGWWRGELGWNGRPLDQRRNRTGLPSCERGRRRRSDVVSGPKRRRGTLHGLGGWPGKGVGSFVGRVQRPEAWFLCHNGFSRLCICVCLPSDGGQWIGGGKALLGPLRESNLAPSTGYHRNLTNFLCQFIHRAY